MPLAFPDTGTCTKQDLIERVRQHTGVSRAESAELVDALLEIMKSTLAEGESLKLSSFGTFHVRSKAPRSGRDFQSATTLFLPARRVVSFKPSQILRDQINDALARGPEHG